MYEAVLNGILHVFALFAALSRRGRADSCRVVEDYLCRNLGLVEPQEYLGLFKDFLEWYEDDFDIGLAEKRLRALCGPLCSRLSETEQLVFLFRLLELIRDLQMPLDQASPLLNILAGELVVSETELQRLIVLVFSPGDRNKYDDTFLVVSAKKETGVSDWRTLHIDAFEGTLLVHAVPEQGVHLFMVQDGVVSLNDNEVSTGVIHMLHPGSVIRDVYGNTVFSGNIESALTSTENHRPQIRFEGADINFTFPHSDQGLHHFSFSECTGRMIGIMGGSGVGKSTLMSILNGSLAPDSGTVKLNGYDLYASPEKLEGVIGYVPQDDLLFEDLTVFENLYYSARLCMADLSADEIKSRVEKMLDELHQLETRDLRVGSPLDKTISGGQRKRLNIALELIREPTVLFVDEPTSGLSSSDSENVMTLLKMQASQGKLIFVNIHQPSSVLFKMFDSLWILDRGGYPIYEGNPLEALRWFREAVHLAGAEHCVCGQCGNVNPEQLFNIIETRTLDETGRFEKKRKYSPAFWHDLYLKRQAERKKEEAESGSSVELPCAVHRPRFFMQVALFFKRTFFSRLANRQYLAINLLEAPILGWLTAMVTRVARGDTYSYGDNPYLVTYFFMSIIAALFMGLSVSAEEIVGDRRVLKRERFLHLSWGGYSLAKFFYLMMVSAIQMALCAGVGIWLLKIPNMFWALWSVMFACAMFGNALGLNCSALFKKAVSIYILIPLLLIPQMLLSGLVIRFDDLMPRNSGHHFVPLIGDVMVSRWGLEALVVKQFCSNEYQQHYFDVEQRLYRSDYMLVDYIPEIRAKLDYLTLKTDIPGKAEKDRQYASVVCNELNALQQMNHSVTGLSEKISPESSVAERRAIHAYLKQLEQNYQAEKETAFDEKQAITERLLQSHTNRETFHAFKKKHHNVNIEKYARNRHDFETIRLSGDRLIQISNPIYQPIQSHWGRAPFMSSQKQLGPFLFSTYAFNLLVIWGMTAILLLALCSRPRK